MQAVVGGKIRMLLCGGAPLADEAHVFIRTCVNFINVLRAALALADPESI